MSPNNLPIISASDRIKQLNNIDKDVAKLLQSAGLAIKALTKPTASAPAEGHPSQPITTEQQKESFMVATSQYFTLLSSVDVNLRRQIFALEVAEIPPAEALTQESPTSLAIPLAAQANSPNSTLSRTVGGNKGVITGGGLGILDVGWLNSRNDNVGKEMDSDLWGEAGNFMHKLEKIKAGPNRGFEILKGDGDQEVADSF